MADGAANKFVTRHYQRLRRSGDCQGRIRISATERLGSGNPVPTYLAGDWVLPRLLVYGGDDLGEPFQREAQGRANVQAPAAAVGGCLQPGTRHERCAKTHGNYRGAAGGQRKERMDGRSCSPSVGEACTRNVDHLEL